MDSGLLGSKRQGGVSQVEPGWMALGSLQKEKCVPLDHKGVSSVIALLAAWIICRLWLGAAVFGLILICLEELVFCVLDHTGG